jgi:hypothetical protein
MLNLADSMHAWRRIAFLPEPSLFIKTRCSTRRRTDVDSELDFEIVEHLMARLEGAAGSPDGEPT